MLLLRIGKIRGILLMLFLWKDMDTVKSGGLGAFADKAIAYQFTHVHQLVMNEVKRDSGKKGPD